MKVSLTPEAERELVEGSAFYAREAAAQLGQDFITEFERTCGLLRQFPLLGAAWRGRIRRLPLRRFPYSIVYYVREAEIRILAIAHQRRRPGFWGGRR